jgi:hypothetical protein
LAALAIRSVERLISHSVTGPGSIRINCFSSQPLMKGKRKKEEE